MNTTLERTYTVWRCDRCGEAAEDGPGSQCEYCADGEGAIEAVQCTPFTKAEAAALFYMAFGGKHPGHSGAVVRSVSAKLRSFLEVGAA